MRPRSVPWLLCCLFRITHSSSDDKRWPSRHFLPISICRYNHQPQQRSGPILRVAILPPGAAIWQVHRPRRWYWVQEQSRAGIVRGSLNRVVTWNFLAQFWATPPLTSIACEPPGTCTENLSFSLILKKIMPNNIYKTLTSSQMNEARFQWHPLTSTDIHWHPLLRKFHPLTSTENDC